MKISKKILSIIFAAAMLFCLLSSHIQVPVLADGDISADDTATIVADYADDRILVILDQDTSRAFKTYTTADFPEVNCKSVTDLTSNIGDLVQVKLNQTQTAAASAAYAETASTFMNNLDTDAYKQILLIELNETGKDKVAAAIKSLSQREDIYSMGLDYVLECESETTTVTDPYYSLQWGLEYINMPDAWDLATSSNAVTIGIIDTGVAASHPDLTNKVYTSLSRDFSLGYAVAGGCVDNNGHGTKVAGVLAAEGNNIGICGVGKNSNIKLVSLKATGNSNAIYASRIILALNYAASLEIPIINISHGIYWDAAENESMPTTYDNASGLYAAIANYPGLIVCSAGNKGMNTDLSTYHHYPSEYDLSNIISVGACTSSGGRASASNYGATTVDLFAPGVSIYTCTSDGSYAYNSGTSFAAPFVSGVAALIVAQYPSLTPAEVKARIMRNTRDVESLYSYCATGGVLDAFAPLMLGG